MTKWKQKDQPVAQSARQKVLQALNSEYASCYWLKGLIFSDFKNELRITFIHSYFASWFKRHAKEHFEKLMRQKFPELAYSYLEPRVYQKFSHKSLKMPVAPKRKRTEEERPISFTNFICSEKNAPALQTLEKVANADPDAPESLVIYGPSGVGKTMLLTTVADIMAAKCKKTIFISAMDFCSGMASSPYENNYADRFWQDIDALILDDLQELTPCPHFAEKLVNFINRRMSRNNEKAPYIIFSLTSESKAGEFQPRLQNRLSEMLWVELKEPDLETKLKYVEQINRTKLLKLNRSQMLALIREARTFPYLKGLLAKIEFLKKHAKNSLTNEIWEQLDLKQGENSLQWKNLVELAARRFHLKPDEILGNSRKSEHVRARQVALYLCRKYLGFSFKELGALFGGKDHSTIMHGIKKIQLLQATDKDMHKLLQEIENNPMFTNSSMQNQANS